MLFAINYHYLGEPEAYPYPGIYPLRPSRFREQIKLLAKDFHFISQLDLIAAIRGEHLLPPRAAMVTLDDGLRCQYEIALPILDGLGVPAIFFVSGLPYAKKRVLTVHKTHWCRAHLAPDDFLEKMKQHHRNVAGREINISEFQISEDELKVLYPYDLNPEEAKLKFILSRDVLAFPVREAIIEGIFKELVNDEGAFCAKFYMDRRQLQELGRRDSIGLHTYSHLALPLLSPEAVAGEIKMGLEALIEVIGRSSSIVGISYPYGQASFPIARVARGAGLEFGFTIEAGFNTTLREPLLLARADTNDAPGGKNPKFAIVNGGMEILDSSFVPYRQRYFDEEVLPLSHLTN